MLNIKDAVAVITGGASGIGLALAHYWAKQGGKLVLGDIAETPLKEAAEQIRGETATVVCDVTQEADCERLAATAIERFGKINLVAPFAGIIKDGLMLKIEKTGKVTGKMPIEDFRSVININLTGVFLTVRECAEQMINHDCTGLICLISSTGSLGTAGQISYSATKAANSVMPRVITAEFFRRNVAHRIRCLAVAPGYVGTPMVRSMPQRVQDKIVEQVPIGRLIEPEEVAAFVGELFRNEALAGDVFFIHGGLRLGSKG
ncbi:MAG: SDR family oxidoreductase [Desulfatitalea sp.]|nr:SDR family oxidoreductase [Desulfatitalea sp.]NNK01854.1 SDR family oxidoreductase [Desulfatitalea sp.]